MIQPGIQLEQEALRIEQFPHPTFCPTDVINNFYWHIGVPAEVLLDLGAQSEELQRTVQDEELTRMLFGCSDISRDIAAQYSKKVTVYGAKVHFLDELPDTDEARNLLADRSNRRVNTAGRFVTEVAEASGELDRYEEPARFRLISSATFAIIMFAREN